MNIKAMYTLYLIASPPPMKVYILPLGHTQTGQ